MKRFGFIIIFLIVFVPELAFTQGQGIKFETELTWSQVKEKAKELNKLILVDCFTTWCLPCKYMADSIFTSDVVGDFVNNQFISIKVQMDTTVKDLEKIKKWYHDAKLIGQKYKITAYPTCLILSSDGSLLKMAVGMSRAPEDFKAVLMDALEYPKLKEQFWEGVADTLALKRLIKASFENRDTLFIRSLINIFIKKVETVFTKENLFLIGLSTMTSKDTGFHIFRNNIDTIDAIQMLKGYAVRFLSPVIFNEDIKPYLSKNTNWRIIEKQVIKKYPDIGEEIVLLQHFDYDRKNGDWINFGKNAMRYMKKYPNKRGDAEFTGIISWAAFQHCNNKKVLKAALKWAMQSISISETSWNLDTYACLLHKLGRTKEALVWMKKSVSKAPLDQELKAHLSKMEKGEAFVR